MLKKHKKTFVLIFALLAVSLIGGVSAYFTATDSAQNTWTVGKVKIDLIEPAYDQYHGAEYLMKPGERVFKDPTVTNVGINDAFVFLKVSIPKGKIIVLDDEGKRITEEGVMQEYFSYTWSDGWEQLSSEETKDEDGNLYQTYILAYTDMEGTCLALPSRGETSALFCSPDGEENGVIVFKRVLEGQGLPEKILDLSVKAFAIQTENITGDDHRTAQEVWKVLYNQSKDIEENGMMEDYPYVEKETDEEEEETQESQEGTQQETEQQEQ